jgi:hypothetical protein
MYGTALPDAACSEAVPGALPGPADDATALMRPSAIWA